MPFGRGTGSTLLWAREEWEAKTEWLATNIMFSRKYIVTDCELIETIKQDNPTFDENDEIPFNQGCGDIPY